MNAKYQIGKIKINQKPRTKSNGRRNVTKEWKAKEKESEARIKKQLKLEKMGNEWNEIEREKGTNARSKGEINVKKCWKNERTINEKVEKE